MVKSKEVELRSAAANNSVTPLISQKEPIQSVLALYALADEERKRRRENEAKQTNNKRQKSVAADGSMVRISSTGSEGKSSSKTEGVFVRQDSKTMKPERPADQNTREQNLLREIENVDSEVATLKKLIAEEEEALQAASAQDETHPLTDKARGEERSEEVSKEESTLEKDIVGKAGEEDGAVATGREQVIAAESEKAVKTVKEVDDDGIKTTTEGVEPLVAREEDQETAETSVRHRSVLDTLLVTIVKEGHELASRAGTILDHLSSEGNFGKTVHPFPFEDISEMEDLKRIANDENGRAAAIGEAVEEERERKRESLLQLENRYRSLQKVWLNQVRASKEKRSREKREILRDRDRFILMATRGTTMIPSSRTASGRVTYKPSGANSSTGAPSSLQEVDIILTQMEAAGGTLDGSERWKRTLARVPPQDVSHVPFDGGSVLIEDPLAEYYAFRAINPWTKEERFIFLEKFLIHHKNFR